MNTKCPNLCRSVIVMYKLVYDVVGVELQAWFCVELKMATVERIVELSLLYVKQTDRTRQPSP